MRAFRSPLLLRLLLVAVPFLACDGSDPNHDQDPEDLDAIRTTFSCPSAVMSGLGGGRNSSLTESDCRNHGDGPLIDYVGFRVPDGEHRNVRLTLNSTEFDPYLMLFNESGTVLAQHDDIDPPSNLNARIEMPNLAAGLYVIGVRPAIFNGSGPYDLSIDTYSTAQAPLPGGEEQ